MKVLPFVIALFHTVTWSPAATVMIAGSWETQAGEVWPNDFEVTISYTGSPVGVLLAPDTTGWDVGCAAVLTDIEGRSYATGNVCHVELRLLDASTCLLNMAFQQSSAPGFAWDNAQPSVWLSALLPLTAINSPSALPGSALDWDLSSSLTLTSGPPPRIFSQTDGYPFGMAPISRTGLLSSLSITPVPEPSTSVLMATAGLYFGLRRRRLKSTHHSTLMLARHGNQYMNPNKPAHTTAGSAPV